MEKEIIAKLRKEYERSNNLYRYISDSKNEYKT